MIRNGIRQWFSWLLLVAVLLGATPAQAEEEIKPITLYLEAVKVEAMIKAGEEPTQVMDGIDKLAAMYTRLDPDEVLQRIEGVQGVAGELIGLKQLFASVKGPDQPVAEYRIHRLVIAFDSLAYPSSPAWLPIARSMENNLDKVIEAVGKQDVKAAKTVFGKLRAERDRIWLALQLHGDPAALNVQVSAHKFIESQLAGERVTDEQGVLNALGTYKGSLGQVTTGLQEPVDPLLPSVTVTLSPTVYASLAGGLLLVVGWRTLRKKKN